MAAYGCWLTCAIVGELTGDGIGDAVAGTFVCNGRTVGETATSTAEPTGEDTFTAIVVADEPVFGVGVEIGEETTLQDVSNTTRK